MAEDAKSFRVVTKALQGFAGPCVCQVMKAIKTLALASLVTACTAATQNRPPVDEGSADQDPLPVVVVDPAAPLPATCAAVGTQTDGEYTLYVGGDKGKPWTAYCADMATTSIEYLPLAMVLGDHNMSQYTAGGASPGTSVRTSYLRLRIDPVTLAIDIGDQRFSVSSGNLQHSFSDAVSSMPFGVAMSCDGAPDGMANIDLRGTEFTIASTFATVGAGGTGAATMDPALQVADLTGGGGCGWTSMTGAPFNPFNAPHAWALQLAYAQ